jgi:hypothetical protein
MRSAGGSLRKMRQNLASYNSLALSIVAGQLASSCAQGSL